MRRADRARIREAKEAGEAARLGRVVPSSDWATRLGSTPGRDQRAALLESLTTAVRDAAEAWHRRKAPSDSETAGDRGQPRFGDAEL